MNCFKVTICGDSPLSHDELAEILGIPLAEEIEARINGTVAILYEPVDENEWCTGPPLTWRGRHEAQG